MKAKQAATKITGTVASPSNPSVKFTELEAPATTKIENGINKKPKLIKKSLKNGTAIPFCNSCGEYWITDIIAGKAINICNEIFSFPFKPKDEFFEIFVSTSLEECEKRDPKGLYKKARAGELKNFTGIDSSYEEPENPDLVLDTNSTNAEELADQIINFLQVNKII